MKKNLSGLLTIAVLVLAGYILWQRQAVNDWVRLRDYKPPVAVVSLADATTMTDDARRMFYVNHPQLQDKSNFNQNCNIEEASIVLGCYIDNRGIFLFDVQDQRLAGVEEVTAAHEVLHAGCDRLSTKRKKEIDNLTSTAFQQVQDQRIEETVENYRSRDANIVPNELHSILATEVRDLPPELEAYYKFYFKDRSKVVAYSEQYEGAFSELKNQVANYDNRLEQLKKQIETNERNLERQADNLTSRRQELDELLASRQYEAYNQGVNDYNALISEYNSLLNSTRRQIEEYNRLVKERNSVAIEEQQLLKALNSKVQPAPTQ